MAVLKNKTQGNYTIVSQNITKNINLSLAERGMLLTLLSLPDNWHLTIRGLKMILPDGKDRISNTLNSLIEKGFVTRIQGRANRGKFSTIDLEIHESPVPNKETDSFSKSFDSRMNTAEDIPPCPEKPDAVESDTGKRDAGNLTQSITNTYSNYTDSTHRVCKKDTLTDAEYANLVSEFGKSNVDFQIERIRNNNYKGCMTYEKIRSWCAERVNRPATTYSSPVKKNSFFNFEQRNYDYDELEKLLLNR